jgi:uncharacterized protein YgiM (DUF1202 family)
MLARPLPSLITLMASLAALSCASGPPGSPSAVGGASPPAGQSEAAEPFLATLTVEADTLPVYAEATAASSVVTNVSSGARLRLTRRMPEWFQVRTSSGQQGFVQPSALITPGCSRDRTEPLVIEEPVFRFDVRRPRGTVVLEAEYTAQAEFVAARVVSNTLKDSSFEQIALADLRAVRFLPPTSACKPRPFVYTFSRRF